MYSGGIIKMPEKGPTNKPIFINSAEYMSQVFGSFAWGSIDIDDHQYQVFENTLVIYYKTHYGSRVRHMGHIKEILSLVKLEHKRKVEQHIFNHH